MTRQEAEAMAAKYNKLDSLAASVVRIPAPAWLELEPSDEDNWWDVEITVIKTEDD